MLQRYILEIKSDPSTTNDITKVELTSVLVRFFQGTDLERIGDEQLALVLQILGEMSKENNQVKAQITMNNVLYHLLSLIIKSNEPKSLFDALLIFTSDLQVLKQLSL